LNICYGWCHDTPFFDRNVSGGVADTVESNAFDLTGVYLYGTKRGFFLLFTDVAFCYFAQVETITGYGFEQKSKWS
jgi:hypothetical protein